MAFVGVLALDLVFAALITILLLLGGSQVIVPLWTGAPVFPMFRRRAALEHKMMLLREQERELKIVEEVEAMHRKLDEEEARIKEARKS